MRCLKGWVMNNQTTYQPNSQIMAMSDRLNIEPAEMHSIIMNTVMPCLPGGKQITNEQFVSFLAVANEYDLNPLTKEIYAFPARGGGIQPIVSIDGWLKIINQHPDFDGLEHEDLLDANGKIIAIKCRIYRKSTSRPVEVSEYMSECAQNTSTWQKWPSRMLRHKATIQAARYAFGLSGIIDPDEADRFEQQGAIEKEINPKPQQADQKLNEIIERGIRAIEAGTQTADQVLSFIKMKELTITSEKEEILRNIKVAK